MRYKSVSTHISNHEHAVVLLRCDLPKSICSTPEGLGYAEGTAADFEEGGFLNGWKKRKLYVDSWMFGSAMQDSGRSVHVKLMLA